MDLTPFVEELRRDLIVAADSGGEEARVLAERLVAPLEAATRLILLNALSIAAEEISRELAPGSVDLRLRGLDPSFVVTAPPGKEVGDEPERAPTGAGRSRLDPSSHQPPGAEESPTARINFRPSEHLKARIEQAAGREGLSVNAWLVRTLTATLSPDARHTPRRAPDGGQQYTGWVR